MHAMVLRDLGQPLVWEKRCDPVPGVGEVRLRVLACAVCRTDLHVVDAELPNVKVPIIPGHEVVGLVDALGPGVSASVLGARMGVGWLGRACGVCDYCTSGRENLCEQPQFTGYTRDGGFATHILADARFIFPLVGFSDAAATAPLLCAGLIGWRCLCAAGKGSRIGLYGFGAAAHIVAQVCRWQGREFFAFTRTGDHAAQDLARSLGAGWAGSSEQAAPAELDAAIIFAPVGSLVPIALKSVRKGGRVVCGGIHMSDIPAFAYRLLWGERSVTSVANLTRQDGHDFLEIARHAGIKTTVTAYRLEDANRALSDLRQGKIQGAAVLVP